MRLLGQAQRTIKYINESYSTAVPILTPGAGGKAMMVNPKVLVLKALYWFTGETHPDSCECEVCQYDKFHDAPHDAQAQRDKVLDQLRNARNLITRPELERRAGYSSRPLSEDEVVWWGNVIMELNGPVSVPRVLDELDGSSEYDAAALLVSTQIGWDLEKIHTILTHHGDPAHLVGFYLSRDVSGDIEALRRNAWRPA